MKVTKNQFLINICLGLAAYWSLGWYIPGPILSVSLSVFAVLVGLAIIFKYFQGWYGVLWRGERSPEHRMAHLGAVGIPAVAASVVYGGVFTLCWNIAGTPVDWLGTPTSNFSRVLLVAGCVALYLTPDDERGKYSLPSQVWLIILFITAVISAFLLGTYVGEDRPRFVVRPAHWAECTSEQTVWVASGSKYYHGPESPWRDLVKARGCFVSAEEARVAGFLPAPVLTSKLRKSKKAVP